MRERLATGDYTNETRKAVGGNDRLLNIETKSTLPPFYRKSHNAQKTEVNNQKQNKL